jgi:PAS domain S-box-containing protein
MGPGSQWLPRFATTMPAEPPPSPDPRRQALLRELGLGDAGASAALDGLVDALLASRAQTMALHAEHQRLLDFGRASGDWMWETDEQLRYVWISEAFETATGLSASSLIGQAMADLPLLDSSGMAHPHRGGLGELLRRRQPFSRAVTEKSTPRGPMLVSRSAVPVFDAQGRFSGYRGTARDVTAQVDAARRARGHDVLLRKLSSQVPGVIFQFLMDAGGGFSYPYASHGLREMFGVEQPFDAAGGDAAVPLRTLHPEERAGFVDSIRESARSLASWQREYRIQRPDGAVRWLETRATPERLPDGGTLWHGFTADITERKETELALRRSEERWEMAADAAGIGIAEAELASGLMILDRRACINHGLGYPIERFTLADWLQQIDEADRGPTQAGLQRALETRGTFETRYLVHRPDGTQATLEITARGRYDAQGQPVGLVGTCRDITAQLAVERLQRDKEAAERANRAKSEFLSRVSHELRTPLNGILGFAQLMSLDRVDTLAPAQQRRLASVERAGRHLLGLINDVLDLTRIESGDVALQPANVDARAAIADCLALIQPLADEAGVRLPAWPAQPAAAWVEADPRAFEQVLMNLLSNAIKYNRPGGRVDIELAAVPGSDGKRLAIAIRDQGRGMDDAQRAALFQPFNRLGAELSRTEGSGLGLVICRHLLDGMGGTLQVDSRPGVGSTFRVELPAGCAGAAAARAAEPARASSAACATGPREVLYIEDEPLNMVLMEEVFRSQPDWTLLVADDGATGARIARESRPDLVLIDMNLPDMSGLTLIQRLRGDPATRPLRCIALSADAMREQIDAAMAAGFDDYWTKPIDVQRVLDDLARLLAQPAAHPAPRSQ